MDDMIRSLRATPPAAGAAGVLIAGDPEAEAERTRRAGGIPLSPALVEHVDRIADDLGVARLVRR